MWGCHSTRKVYAGGVAERKPIVTLEAVTDAKESPARGYPVLPYPTPAFPWGMVRAGIEGEVIVRLVVGTDGLVKEASIVKSSQREFEAAVLSATRLWRFREIPDVPPVPARGLVVDCRFKFAFDED